MRTPARTTACASRRVLAPRTTPASTTANGPTLTPSPRSASGETAARSCTSSVARISGLPVDDRREKLTFGTERPLDARLAAKLPHIRPVMDDLDVKIEPVA